MIIEKLNKNHKKERFDCGNEVLNIFLKKYAYQNQNRYLVGVTSFLYLSIKTIEKIYKDKND